MPGLISIAYPAGKGGKSGCSIGRSQGCAVSRGGRMLAWLKEVWEDPEGQRG